MAQALNPLSPVAADRSCDHEFVERLRAGDAAGLGDALQRYWSGISAYARRMLNDPDLGNDVAQETFVRVWDNRDQLKSETFRTYLYRIAHNLAVDELRKSQTRSCWKVRHAHRVASVPATPLDLLEQDDLARAVNRAIEALPTRRREVFTLAYVHRMSYGQIAEVLRLSPATVKNQMTAALAHLRDRLQSLVSDR